MLVNGQCAAFPGNNKFHLSSEQQVSIGGCRERCAASIGSVLANIENDIANILKIKSVNQYTKYINHQKRPELTCDVYFFLFSRYRCTPELRILSLVCSNSTRRGLRGTTTKFHKLP